MKELLSDEYVCEWKEVIKEIKKMDNVFVTECCEIKKCECCNGYRFSCSDYQGGGKK